jgi:hypothetical protein
MRFKRVMTFAKLRPLQGWGERADASTREVILEKESSLELEGDFESLEKLFGGDE